MNSSPLLATIDPPIAAAWIAGAFGIVVAIITNIDKLTALGVKVFKPPLGDRMNAAAGHWVGHDLPQKILDVSTPLDRRLDVDLTVEPLSGKRCRGEIKVSEGGEQYTLIFTGQFVDQNHLRLDYQNKDVRIVQFGMWLLRLSANATHLCGGFIGFSKVEEKIIIGDINLGKAAV
jgi:hypothetical protein